MTRTSRVRAIFASLRTRDLVTAARIRFPAVRAATEGESEEPVCPVGMLMLAYMYMRRRLHMPRIEFNICNRPCTNACRDFLVDLRRNLGSPIDPEEAEQAVLELTNVHDAGDTDRAFALLRIVLPETLFRKRSHARESPQQRTLAYPAVLVGGSSSELADARAIA